MKKQMLVTYAAGALACALIGYAGVGWFRNDHQSGAAVAGQPMSTITERLAVHNRGFQDLISELSEKSEQKNKNEQLSKFLGQVEEPEISEIYIISGTTNDANREWVMTAVLNRWFELNPKDAIEHAQLVTPFVVRPSLWKNFLKKWAAINENEAKRWALDQPAGRQRRESIISVAEAIFKSNRSQAIDLLLSQNLTGADAQIFEAIFSLTPSSEFDSAFAQAMRTKSIDIREAMLSGLVKTLEGKSPETIVDWLCKLPAGKFRESNLTRIINRWLENNPEGALKCIVSMPISSERTTLFSKALSKFANWTPIRAADFFNRLTNARDREIALNALLEKWGRVQPDACLAFANGLVDEKERQNALRLAAGVVGKSDPHAAISLIQALPAGKTKDAAMESLVEQWGNTDPRAALTAGLAANLDPDKSRAIGNAVANLLKQDENGIKVLYAMVAPESRISLIANGLLAYGNQDRQAAIKLSFQLEPEIKQAVTDRIAEALSFGAEPEIVVDYVSKLQPGNTKSKAAIYAAMTLAYVKPAEAIAWASKITGQSTDETAALVAYKLSRAASQEAALQTVPLIQDKKRRSRLAEDIVSSWLDSRNSDARKWLQSSTLFDEAAKQRILKGN